MWLTFEPENAIYSTELSYRDKDEELLSESGWASLNKARYISSVTWMCLNVVQACAERRS